MSIRSILAGASAGLALIAALPAAAQSIDYGSLEQMFNEPVTTSATGTPQRASQAPVDMEIISAQDIQRSGAADIPTILSRVAGLDVLNWSAGAQDVGIRGYNTAYNPRLLVLVNGREVYMDFYGYTAWSTLPVRLEEIRQIEVVKGPNTALFGFNAVSGVINIITYNPKFDDKSFATGRVGSEGYKEASLGQSVKLGDRFAARLTGGVSQQHEYKDTLGVGQLYTPVERVTANVDTVTQLAEKLQFRVEGSWSHERQNDMSSVYIYTPSKYLVTGLKGALEWESPIGTLQAQGYQNRASAKFGATEFHNTLTVASVQDLAKLGSDHTVRVAAEYRKTSLPFGRGVKLQYAVRSVSGMWNWQMLSNVALTLAGRYDDLRLSRESNDGADINSLFARRITAPSYNAGLAWNATQRDTLRVTYARGAQIPALQDLGVQVFVGPGALLVGNPNLLPTVVTNYGVTYDRSLPEIGGAASVRLFYQKSTDVKGQPNFAAPDATTPIIAFSYMNVADSDMRGVETKINGAYKNGVRWSANYTYTDVQDKQISALIPEVRKAAFAATTPKHRGNLNVGWDGGRWSVDSFVHYQSSYELYDPLLAGQPLVKVGGFATLAGRVAYNFDHGFTLALSGQNLGADRQEQTTGLRVERRVFATLSKTW